MSKYVEYKDLEPSKLIIDKVDKKKVPDNSASYTLVTFKYNYGTNEAPNYARLYIEYPLLSAADGIATFTTKDGSMYSYTSRLLPENPDHELLRQKLHELYDRIVELLISVKTQVGMPLAKFTMDTAPVLLKYPVYYPVNKETSEVIQGVPPYLACKLMDDKYTKTKFLDLTDAVLTREELMDCAFDHITLTQWNGVFIGGGRIAIQNKAYSTIITNIYEKQRNTPQKNTLERLKKNPELINKLREQKKKLKEKQESLPSDVSNYVFGE